MTPVGVLRLGADALILLALWIVLSLPFAVALGTAIRLHDTPPED